MRNFPSVIYSLLLLLGSFSACVTNTIQQPQQNKKTNTSNTPTDNMNKDGLNYLALGDSYTIGEGVQRNETYPARLVDLLKEQKLYFDDPKIIAVTGWTTDELQQGIKSAEIDGKIYDLVTLLIGVNNQYRGRDLNNYKEEFTDLLHQAIGFAGGNKNHVIVLSIPDWGVTDFAKQQNVDKDKVALEIDTFNETQENICKTEGITFLDITIAYRQNGSLPENQAEDGLHPSGNIYRHWAEKLASHIEKQINFR